MHLTTPISRTLPARGIARTPRRRRSASKAIRCSVGKSFLASASSSMLCAELMRMLSEHQVHVFFGNGAPRRGTEQVRGVLLLGDAVGLAESSAAAEAGVPVVGLNVPSAEWISTVCTDYRQQAERVVDHLHQRGHRRIAMILGSDDSWAATERRKGFVAALARRDLPVVPEGIVSTVHQPTYGLLNRLVVGWKPTAVFLACEEVTIESVSILREMTGGQIPSELSLVGLETPHISRYESPPLTTIAEPIEQLADAAVRLLMRQIKATECEPEHLVLESNLIERASVRTLVSE